jgi:hypothetical protein
MCSELAVGHHRITGPATDLANLHVLAEVYLVLIMRLKKTGIGLKNIWRTQLDAFTSFTINRAGH